MRKTAALLILFAITICNTQAQSEERTKGTTTKNGQYILPQTGDFAIGIDATPFLEYIGNIFTDAHNEAPSFGDMTFFGKYFLSPDRAIRARLRLNSGSDIFKGAVKSADDIAPDPNSLPTVVDKKTQTGLDLDLSAGYEYRRGYGRIQGFYGGGVVLGYGHTKDSYDYGNPITQQGPPTTDFETGMTIFPYKRVIAEKAGRYHFGVNGFAGLEYFIAPKLCIGAELGIDLVYAGNGKVKTKKEHIGSSNKREVTEIETYNPKSTSSSLSFKTKTNTNLYIMFHF